MTNLDKGGDEIQELPAVWKDLSSFITALPAIYMNK